MRNMEVIRDGSFALRSPDYVDVRFFAAATAEAHAVPTGGNYVVFQGTVDFYVRYNATAGAATAVVPAADVTNGTGGEMNPTVRYIAGIVEISVIPAVAGTVTMAFYR